MGSDIYTADSTPILCRRCCLPLSLLRDTSTTDTTSFWLAPTANGSVGVDLSPLATAEHTCGTARPLPDTSTGPGSPARVRREQPLATALDLDPFNPAGSGGTKERGSRSASVQKNPSAISTPATSSSFCESGLEGYLVLINPHLLTVRHSASGAQRSTELVCILEGHKELSHLTSYTSQPIHFHSVALYLSLITPTLRLSNLLITLISKEGLLECLRQSSLCCG